MLFEVNICAKIATKFIIVIDFSEKIQLDLRQGSLNS